jgi:hypothetical protein
MMMNSADDDKLIIKTKGGAGGATELRQQRCEG